MIDERTEQLITRRLDAQLAEGESLELDKELIRSPEARQAFEDSQQIDALAVETLHALLDNGGQENPKEAPTLVTHRPHRLTRWFLDGAIGAAAAALLIVVGTSLLSNNSPKPDGGINRPNNGLEIADISQHPRPQGPSLATPRIVDSPALTEVIAGPRRQHERIDHNVIGVVDPETESVYLLEIESARDTVSRVRAYY